MGRAPIALAILLGVSACADTSPIIREVDRLRTTADPVGPYVIAVRIDSGDAPLAVQLIYTDGDFDPLDALCADGPPLRSQRTADAGLLPGADGALPDGTVRDRGMADAAALDQGIPGDALPDSARPDAGLSPGRVPCYRVDLRSDGRSWRAAFDPGPLPLGTRLLYRLVAVDDDGDLAVCPEEGPADVEVAHSEELAVDQLEPTRGPAIGGTEVLLRGQGFGPGLVVRFGGRAAEVRLESAQLAVATAPGGSPGSVAVEVERIDTRVRLPEGFTYEPPPVIERVDPSEAPADRPLLLIVDGERFEPGSTIRIGDRPPEAVLHVEPTRIVADVAPHPAGVVDVTVIDPFGQAAVAVAALTLHPPPRLDALAPERGPDSGGSRIRLSGADFRRPVAVWFGERRAATVNFVDESTIDARSPVHPAGVIDVTVYNPDGQGSTLVDGWRFVGSPFVDRVEPDVAGRCGGALVVLRGRNFELDMRVSIGGLDAEVLEVSDDGTEARVRLPRGGIGPVRVEVVGADGRVFRSDDLLTFDRRPIVRAVEPERVPIWGQDDVVIRGADLDAVAGVAFEDRPALGFEIVPGEDPCDGRLLVDTPPGDDGPVDIQLDDARGEAARLPGGLTYVAPRIAPDRGLQPGYTNVTLTGIGLVADLAITIGGRAPRAIERISDERWRLVTPAGEPGAAPLRFALARSGRGATVAPGFTYTVFADRTARWLDAPGDCNDVSVADVDGDGQADVIGAFGGIGSIEPSVQAPAIFRNRGDRFDRQPLDPAGNGINGRVGDVDGDGDLDILVANLSGPENRLYLGDGVGGFRVDPRFAASDSSYDADFLDADGDGDLDVFSLRIGSPENGNLEGPEQLWLNDGEGRFVDASGRLPNAARDVHDHDFAHGDLDGDGDPDIVIVVDNLSDNFATARNRLWINEGNGRFRLQQSPFNDVRGDWLDVELVDLDGDGDLDVLMPQDYLEGFSFPGTPAIAMYLNNGDATFVAAHERFRGMPRVPAYEAVPVDLDRDGDLDVLVAVYGILFGDGTIEPFRSVLMLNDGTATWHEATSAFVDLPTIATSNYGVADFDGDGDLDLFECAARGQSRMWTQEAP